MRITRVGVGGLVIAAVLAVGVLPAVVPSSVEAASCVRISGGRFDAPGNDNLAAHLNGEYVRIKNDCTVTRAMARWRVTDYGTKHTYTFPSTFKLGAGKTVTLYSGRGTNTATRRYWGRTSGEVWHNAPPERAYLRSSTGALLSSWSPFVPAPAPIVCTYTFPDAGGHLGGDGLPGDTELGSVNNPVKDGDVICGGPGDDSIIAMAGGIFYGGGGNDSVWFGSGTFYGGPGDDYVHGNGGTFYGGPGDDYVHGNGGVVDGGDGNDSVTYNYGGTFDGGAGDDTVTLIYDGVFNGGSGADSVDISVDGGVFNGEDGEDHAAGVLGGTFNGGNGDDSVTSLSGGLFDGGDGTDTVVTYTGGACLSVVDCPR